MNLHVSIIGPKEAALRAAARERRQKWAMLKPQKPIHAIEAPKSPMTIPDSRPLWTRQEIHFDAHIHEPRLVEGYRVSPKVWLRKRCRDLGFDFDRVIGDERHKEVVAVRQALIWEMRRLYPDTSLPEMGRIFGDRDHTTILHAIRKVDAKPEGKRSADSLPKWTSPNVSRSIRHNVIAIGAKYRSGASITAILRDFHICRKSLQDLIDRYGWERAET